MSSLFGSKVADLRKGFAVLEELADLLGGAGGNSGLAISGWAGLLLGFSGQKERSFGFSRDEERSLPISPIRSIRSPNPLTAPPSARNAPAPTHQPPQSSPDPVPHDISAPPQHQKWPKRAHPLYTQ